MEVFKLIFKWKLKTAVTWIISRQNPFIVGITGSVGKTFTRHAVESVLAHKFKVSKSVANFNNEFGLPFTILGVPYGLNKFVLPFASIYYFFKSYFTKKYPDLLVLEMGADRPGDLKYLTQIARPNLSIVTKVGQSHSEFFGGLNEIQKEKAEIIRALPETGTAILCEDDPRVLAMKALHRGKILTFGFSESADIRAENYTIIALDLESGSADEIRYGSRFDLVAENQRHRLTLRHVIGRPAIYASLAAFAAGKILKISNDQIFQTLSDLEGPPGRLCVLTGIKNTILLDDTYNASPESTAEALRVLKQIRGKRKIAVLGDMLELGPVTEKAHRLMGRLAADLRLDLLFTVGARSNFTAEEARKSGIAKTKVKEFENSIEAGRELQDRIKEGDAVLVKGSQGMRMEKIIEEVMAYPERAGELLCRQSKAWKKKAVSI